jgi:hypothetical protein
MSGKMTVFDDSYSAGADLSTHQYKGVVLTGAGTVGLQDASGLSLGVLQNKPRLGEGARVMHIGRTKCLANGASVAIAVGDRLRPGVGGVFEKAPLGTETNIIGIAEEACTISGGLIDMSMSFF